MAAPILRMEPTQVSVEPGMLGSVVVTVHNPGTVVEGYAVDVVSTVPMPWAEVDPPVLSVYPQQEATAVVTFGPPSGPGAPGGAFPFGVRARSQVDDSASAVVEGDLAIGLVAGLHATLAPVTSSGRWSARHTLTVTNSGNAAARLRVVADDPDQALGFLVSPGLVEVPVGGQAVARVRVRTRHPRLRGQATRLPFTVVGEPDPPPAVPAPRAVVSTPERPLVSGAFTQQPILTRLVVSVAGLLVLGLIGAIAFLLSRPADAPPPRAVAAPAAPTGLRADPLPGVVNLTWDRDQSVSSYELIQTLPTTSSQTIEPYPAEDDPDRQSMRLAVATADRYCYRLRALRGETPSADSESVCVDSVLTPAQSAAPTPTESPTIETMAPPTEAPSPSGTTVAADPLPFVFVLKSYSPDVLLEGAPTTDLQTLEPLGVPAKVMSTVDHPLEPPLGEPTLVLYVDGVSAEAATTACTGAQAVAPRLVQTDCSAAFLRTLAPTSPTGPVLPSAPGASLVAPLPTP